MIDQLITVLNQEVDLSAEEIADTLWLAMHMGKSKSNINYDSENEQSLVLYFNSENIPEKPSNTLGKDISVEKEDNIEKFESLSITEEGEKNQAELYNQKPDPSEKIPFKIPDPPSLRNQLDLARALKPLMRYTPSGKTLVLDETATVHRIANERIWLPVIQPNLEPWLSLELVIDEGISMQIWRHTIKELERLLKSYGIFRDVRVWGLISNEQNKIQIRRGIGATAKNQSLRSASELIDFSGRRLVLVVSDCVSDLWCSGAVNLALKTWANNVPTAIIQMLPQWLWGRTALGRATEVRFQGLAPSVSNRQLIANTVSLWSEIDEATGIKVPVFTLEPERVSTWAQMLVGKGSIQTSGFIFKPEIRDLKQEKPLFNLDRGELTPEQRVQAFRVTASPMARKLAGLIASAPVISLPVVRLIRETMLKESQQVHVAEVFLGGLLKPLSEIEVDTDPDYVQYGFIDGVRELLVDSVPTSSVLNVVEEVSKFVAKNMNLSFQELTVILRNPQQASDSKLHQIEPFAKVSAEILRRLGGQYELLADNLEQATASNSSYKYLIESKKSQLKKAKLDKKEISNKLSELLFDKVKTTEAIDQRKKYEKDIRRLELKIKSLKQEITEITEILLSPSRTVKQNRALSTYALNDLNDNHEFDFEIASSFIHDAIQNINDLDGKKDKPYTDLDIAFSNVINSHFGTICKKILIESYIKAHGYNRISLGCIILFDKYLSDKALDKKNHKEVLNSILEKLESLDATIEERICEGLILVNLFFKERAYNTKTLSFLPYELLDRIISILLKIIGNHTNNNEALSFTSVWALTWLTNSKLCSSFQDYKFNKNQLNLLRNIIKNKRIDSALKAYSAKILSVSFNGEPTFAQTDWIYEWAVVADGNKPHTNLSKINFCDSSQNVNVIKTLLFSNCSIKAKKDTAISLGRLQCFCSEMIDPLLAILHDINTRTEDRDEALVYLAHIGDAKVISELISIMYKQQNKEESYDFSEKCFLALLAIGDTQVLIEEFKSSINSKNNIVDLQSIAYILAGVEDPNAKKYLNSLTDSDNDKIKNIVFEALSKIDIWNSGFSDEKQKKSDLFDKHVTNYISKRGYLIHRLKAKDSTGRWAYYFVHVRESHEESFLKALDSNESIDLEDFGKVIASNYGEKPSDQTIKILKEKYDFDV